VLAQTISADFVLHPFFVRAFEMLGFAKLCEAQRRHDSLCLPLREIVQAACQTGAEQKKRSPARVL